MRQKETDTLKISPVVGQPQLTHIHRQAAMQSPDYRQRYIACDVALAALRVSLLLEHLTT